MKQGLVVILEDGVYLGRPSKGPGKTSKIDQAIVFKSAAECRKAIAWARTFSPFEKARIGWKPSD